ncbi:MAG: hypothetical protein QF436_03440 [Candidatus Woesearchaeota archaeon]|jgi:hypothetical protein|nr:hypothetical protein [Candidatus Woesearchaeota archaeon]MDP7262907.1 hypothetical protein [Candidatus Woesearchaeota archaeon]MDP7623143.1 hypothetical protein [Candidatus Woesearchaeota archaeon]HJN56788.1 hypothetical protein [Candidatus Woesearchaeota archaeon]|tara:strand:+ start:37557 stop:37700 length:144 start_codon:yes stop_codon:yes gene_type:complete
MVISNSSLEERINSDIFVEISNYFYFIFKLFIGLFDSIENRFSREKV